MSQDGTRLASEDEEFRAERKSRLACTAQWVRAAWQAQIPGYEPHHFTNTWEEFKISLGYMVRLSLSWLI